MMWIVGVTNAFNLIDGLDGLATGIGTVGWQPMSSTDAAGKRSAGLPPSPQQQRQLLPPDPRQPPRVRA